MRGGGVGVGVGARRWFYAVSLISAVLAQKTREISFTLPFIIAFYEFGFFEDSKGLRQRLLYLAPFILALAIIPLILFGPEIGIGHGGSGVAEKLRELKPDIIRTSLHDYLLTRFVVVMTCLRLLILPVGQNLLYDHPLSRSFFEPQVLFPFFFLCLLFAIAAWFFARSRRTGNAYALPQS